MNLDMPAHMEPGSYGPVIDTVVRFLNEWSERNLNARLWFQAPSKRGLEGQATRLLMEFQRRNGLDPDGGCGPLTRSKMLEFGLDLDKLAHRKDAEDEINAFVQSDGSVLYWAKYLPATTDRRSLEIQFRRSRHGN